MNLLNNLKIKDKNIGLTWLNNSKYKDKHVSLTWLKMCKFTPKVKLFLIWLNNDTWKDTTLVWPAFVFIVLLFTFRTESVWFSHNFCAHGIWNLSSRTMVYWRLLYYKKTILFNIYYIHTGTSNRIKCNVTLRSSLLC